MSCDKHHFGRAASSSVCNARIGHGARQGKEKLLQPKFKVSFDWSLDGGWVGGSPTSRRSVQLISSRPSFSSRFGCCTTATHRLEQHGESTGVSVQLVTPWEGLIPVSMRTDGLSESTGRAAVGSKHAAACHQSNHEMNAADSRCPPELQRLVSRLCFIV